MTLDKANLQQELAATRMGMSAPAKLDGGASDGNADKTALETKVAELEALLAANDSKQVDDSAVQV